MPVLYFHLAIIVLVNPEGMLGRLYSLGYELDYRLGSLSVAVPTAMECAL